VEDVGATRSYDLHATRGDEVLHIEVKGSTQAADSVELTVNEVTHARQDNTDLVVVDQITYVRLDDGTIHGTDGRMRLWSTWQPAKPDLDPTRFRYRLPPDTPTTPQP
jgi:Protein NO VEIN, C-terminal